MNEQQARELAAHIQSQCPLHVVAVLQGRRGNWIIGVKRGPDDVDELIVESRFEWEQALLAWRMLRD